MVETQKIVEELVIEEPISFEYQSLTIYDTHYDKSTNKLQFENIEIKTNKIVCQINSEINVLEVEPSRLLKLHHIMRDDLAHFMA